MLRKLALAVVALVLFVSASPNQPRTVPQTKALVALDPPAAETVIYRAGYYTPGDGGAAFYVFSTSACPLKDGAGDGGSQIQPNSGGGCWIFSPPITPSVLVWGVDATGATDSSSLLQNAVNSVCAGSIPGNKLWFPPGSYEVHDVTANCSGFHFIGAGIGATTINCANMTSWCLRIAPTNFPVQNRLVGGSFEDLRFINSGTSGIVLDVVQVSTRISYTFRSRTFRRA
jgi:hypothetical protein